MAHVGFYDQGSAVTGGGDLDFEDGEAIGETQLDLESRPITANLYQLCNQVTRERGYWKDQAMQWKAQCALEAAAREETAQRLEELAEKELAQREEYNRLLETCRNQRNLMTQLQHDYSKNAEELAIANDQMDKMDVALKKANTELNHVHDYMGRGIRVLEKRDAVNVIHPSEAQQRNLELGPQRTKTPDVQYGGRARSIGTPTTRPESSHQELSRAKADLARHLRSLNNTQSPAGSSANLYVSQRSFDHFEQTNLGTQSLGTNSSLNKFNRPGSSGYTVQGQTNVSPTRPNAPPPRPVSSRPTSSGSMNSMGSRGTPPGALVVQRGGRSVRVRGAQEIPAARVYTPDKKSSKVSLQPIVSSPKASR